MAVAHRTPRVDLSGRTLLLGDHGAAARTPEGSAARDGDPDAGIDVVLLDLAGVAPHDVAARVAEVEAEPGAHSVGVRSAAPPAVAAALAAGVGLVVLVAGHDRPEEVRAVTEAGVVVVLSAPDPAVAVAAVDDLHASGIDTTRVVVEVEPGPGLVDRVAALEHAAYGYRVGAALPPLAVDADDLAVGGQIGLLTALLATGLATVRDADPRRFHRVRAVVEALHDAARSADAGVGPTRVGPTGDGEDGP